MLEEVKLWTKKYLEDLIQVTPVNCDQPLFDFEEFDSFDLVQLIENAENEFGFKFENTDFERVDFATINGLCKIIVSKFM
jgi:acyl carrier protein